MIPQILAPHILSAEALSEGFIEQGYYCYEEDADKNVPLRELYDKGILKRNNDYFTSSYVNTDRPDMKGRYIQFNELTDEEKDKFYEDWDKILNESLAHWNTQYWQAHESVETNTTIVHDLDEEEDAEWDRRIESGELKPIENGNTDLTEIGFDQSELGGAKQRFRNNVEAIKLVNRLHRENRAATAEERKVLSGYVGWGGLAQAFDEHNTAWQKEYAELKNILTDEEYAAAKGSVLNAHYTSKEVIEGIYRALSRFGVKGNNRILEPAMGTGNFFGFMPKEISDGAHLYGVELDRITGRIATKLYPQARIQIKGFEETCFQDNSFDLMVTNVPFGGYGVFDPDYNKHHFLIHDYFIAKGIDKIKPNGLMAVITSKGTLDKLNPSVRKYIADRAELIGAVRLPNTAFKKTANTEVVTDILFFRKREEAINANVENTEWLSTGKTEEGFEVNKYYLTTMLKKYLMEGRDEFSKVRGLVNTVLITSDKTLTSYLSEVNSYMQQLSDDGIMSMTAENDLDIVNLDEQPNAVFIIVPDERFTRHRFVTLFITQMYKELVEKANLNLRRGEKDTAILKRNTYFVLDEFANLPKFDNIEGMVTVARSRGIRFLFVLQSYSQLTAKYGRDVGDIIKTNCNEFVS